jgi:hypothetical protein
VSTVAGSKQYKSIVVEHKPGRRVLLVVTIVVLLCLVAVVAYWQGARTLQTDFKQLEIEHQQVLEQLSEVSEKYEVTSQQLANHTVSAEVDLQAMEEVRTTVREHKQTIAELNEEITFYKGLMAPTDRERGLGIRSWEVYATSYSQSFQFKLIVQQLAIKHQLLTGSVTAVIIGTLDGEKVSLPLHTISEQITKQDITLRFKYFQYIEGELTLPVGFVPEQIDLVAQATKPNVVQVEKQYAWLVQK